jgi:hypothetical protein
MTAGNETWERPAEAVGLLLRGRTVRTACPTALVVGTVLSAVNQGFIVIEGQATIGTWVRIAVNYVVPFAVASTGYLAARRVRDLPATEDTKEQPPPRG